ncbi:hypothetical protein ACFV0O_02920 [Kitasatospora sp. NPDC059577]|uniref:recombination directionality factor n=1 Tax=Kitasatospora sp. NPDC059577 TaxID=3346873 RepID=UPI0036C51DC1
MLGRFHLGSGPVHAAPAGEPGWRIATASRKAALVLAPLVGATEARTASEATNVHDLQTGRDEFTISVDGAHSLSSRMVMRGRRGMHMCDGIRFVETTGAEGTPCGCPPTWPQRRAASRAGRGPKPEIALVFRLPDAPELGYFDLVSSSWLSMEEVQALAAVLSPGG